MGVGLKTPANKEAMLRKRCCRSKINVSLFATPGKVCCGSKVCFPGKSFSICSKTFASSANVSSFASQGNISGNNVSATFPHTCMRVP